MKQPPFLPMSRKEMDDLGWDSLDVLLLSGDAYVDHPSFGTALLGRWLVNHGFKTGVVAQPEWRDRDQTIAVLSEMGRPNLFAGANAGAIDSMLAHYTAFRKKRSDDAYTPGGQAGARPNRAVIMYTGFLRQAFPGLPVVIGGIEASLRRITHYDFWEDKLRRSVLLDAKADLLLYGMGEQSLLSVAKIAQQLEKEKGTVDRLAFVNACTHVPGIAYSMPTKAYINASELAEDHNDSTQIDQNTAERKNPPTREKQEPPVTENKKGKNEPLFLPSHEEIQATASLLMQATMALETQVHNAKQKIAQQSGDRMVIVNPPQSLVPESVMDEIYGLAFSRMPHPSYTLPIPAWEMIRTSITTHRGCGGGCSFCSLALHQGRHVASRSEQSIIKEAAIIAKGPNAAKTAPRWAGSISDVGGPSANMWQAKCAKGNASCFRESCMHPKPCRFFLVDQMAGVRLLRKIASAQGIRHVRVASGVRFDLALQDKEALFGYTAEFTGGQLKVAPEHVCSEVLDHMRKPGVETFESFLSTFFSDSAQAGKEQYTIPYLMSAFPGCTIKHMKELGTWLSEHHWKPQQVQCFIPTPGTVATAMFYAKVDTHGQPIYVARTDKERMEQHHCLFGEKRESPHRGDPHRGNPYNKGNPHRGISHRSNTQRDDSHQDVSHQDDSQSSRPQRDRPQDNTQRKNTGNKGYQQKDSARNKKGSGNESRKKERSGNFDQKPTSKQRQRSGKK